MIISKLFHLVKESCENEGKYWIKLLYICKFQRLKLPVTMALTRGKIIKANNEEPDEVEKSISQVRLTNPEML